MSRYKNEVSVARVMAAGALSWILPGLGHLYLGQRQRALVLLVAMTLTFWTGVAIGGVQSTVKPAERKAWFMAQICAGGHTLACYTWGTLRSRNHPTEPPRCAAENVAVIYTGIAGLLNVLIILDALASADPQYVRVSRHPRPEGAA